jgi:hypothetical protein
MRDYVPDTSNAALEGDDILPPIRVFQFGKHFVSAEGGALIATGPECLATLARKLLALGHSPDQELDVERGGDHIARLSLRDAAQGVEP